MRHLLHAAVIASFTVGTSALAAAPCRDSHGRFVSCTPQTMTPQARMTKCSADWTAFTPKDAGGKTWHGQTRQQWMSTCLKAH